jgi:hypothetical protein
MNKNEKSFCVEREARKGFWFLLMRFLSDEDMSERKKWEARTTVATQISESASVFVSSLRGVDYSHEKQKI